MVYFILIKGEIHQEEIIANLHVPSVTASNFIKHTELGLKTQIDHNTAVVRDINTPLSPNR
jgi:hypothetical protein